MASAIRIRGGHRAMGTKHTQLLQDLLSEEPFRKEEVECVLELISKTKETLETLDQKIQEAMEDDEEMVKDMTEAAERQLELSKWLKRGKLAIQSLENVQLEVPVSVGLKKENHIKLPTIKLPTFNGDSLFWQPFWDVFKSSVHDRTEIVGSQKFSYLKGQLKDEALQLIEGFSTTDNDYMEAIELLKSTYGKPYKIIEAHLNAIFDIQGPQCNATELSKFRANYESHLRSLKALSVEVESAGFVFAAYLLRKLPIKIKDNLNRAAKSDRWDLDSFRRAIESEISLLQAVEPEAEKKNDERKSKFIQR